MKDVIICDLDGTIALDKHRNHFLHPPHKPDCKQGGLVALPCTCGWKRDWDSYYDHCDSDEPNWPVIRLLTHLREAYWIILLTGRIERTREVTIKWLNKYKVPYSVLKMRPTEDRTQDDKMKIAWAQDLAGGPDKVEFILEDRQRVVDAWRAAGYTCFQVAPGTF